MRVFEELTRYHQSRLRFDYIDSPGTFEESRIHREGQMFQEEMEAALMQAMTPDKKRAENG
jgi:hypothetical protein